MAEILMELEDLRGDKNIITLNVVVRPNRSECFSWTTDAETTTIKELERAIYAVHPDREDGEVVLAIIHVCGTPQHEVGGTEYPSDGAVPQDEYENDFSGAGDANQEVWRFYAQ
ncbi:hypothetical protein BGX27_004614 [Mortierella sp. AM989]|nr:hypothetical protein BGX27_004614 [Mortierella sp. AM989]